jgi:hypothetical protein
VALGASVAGLAVAGLAVAGACTAVACLGQASPFALVQLQPGGQLEMRVVGGTFVMVVVRVVLRLRRTSSEKS